jgi:uncharacterized protein YciI
MVPVLVLLLATAAPGFAQDSDYDEALAKKLKADDMGMRKYVMAFLKRGPNRAKDAAEAKTIQAGHMANIGRMAKEGKLVVAGPFMDNGELRGIYIFNVESVAEAEELTKTDPAIQAGTLVMELHPWYGSAAMQEVNGIHNRIAKKKF